MIKWRGIEGFRMLTRHGKKAVIASILAIVLVIMIGIPIAFYLRGFLIPNFSRVAGLSDQLKELTGIDLRLIVVSFFSAIVFSILLGSDLPIVVSNLFFSDRAEMLLSLPVKKATVANVQLLEVLTAGGLPILLFAPIFMAALRGLGYSGGRFWMALVLLLIFVLNTLAITAIISFGIVFLSKGRFLKTLSAMMTMVTLFVFIFTLRFMDFSSIDLAQPDQVANQFGGLQELITSAYLPWSPFVRAITGDVRDLLLFMIVSVTIFALLALLEIFVYPRVLQKLMTRPIGNSKVHSRMNFRRHGVLSGLLIKDFLLLIREPKLTFAFLYPSLFVPVVVIVNPALLNSFGVLQLLGLIVFLSSNYATVSSTALFAFERQLGDGTWLFPINRVKAVLSKSLVVSSLYSVVIIIVGLYVSANASQYRAFMMNFLILMIPTVFTLSLLGGFLEKSFGTKDTRNVFKALSLSGAILSFLLSTLLPVFSTLPLTLYLAKDIGLFLGFLNVPVVSPFTWLFGLVFPLSLWAVITWASFRSRCAIILSE
ncbi:MULTISPECIES: hypothetical protein [unclassified Mesotoga]|uniref:hypothetical protein n=1 Tax=unclassified Mesotoga TaxID=1184398 RepID=UPI0021AC70BA|nr:MULTISPECIES: hypothetical protein [unclassified Mesotoga]